MSYEMLLRATVYITLVVAYLLFPIWMLLGGLLFQIVFVFGIAVVLPEAILYLIDQMMVSKGKTVDIVAILRRNSSSIGFFFVSLFVYSVILLPLLVAPIKPIDDEPEHIGRIVFFEEILTLGSRLNSVEVGLAVCLATLTVIAVMLIASGITGKNRLQTLCQRLFDNSAISRVFHIAVGAVFSVLVVLSSSFTVYEWHISRFGPLQPVAFVTPLLLLGYASITVVVLRVFDVALMVLAAVFIKKITIDLLDILSTQTTENRRVRELIGMATGWMFLLYTPTLIFSAQVMLTAGVAMFFTLNCFLLVRFFKSSVSEINRTYLLTLFLSLAVGSLWKRVILIQAAAFAFVLLLWSLNRPNRRDSILTWLRCCLIYLLFFGPWFVFVQLGGAVSREYVFDPLFILPPTLFDYFYRLNLQMGLFWGALGYASILILVPIAIWKRSWIISAIPATYGTWYVFFTLDAGWPHTVDRFFVPALSLLAISSAILLSILIKETINAINGIRRATTESTIAPTHSQIMRLLAVVLTVVLLMPFALGIAERCTMVPQAITDSANNQYLAYDQAAQFIDSKIMGDSSKLYSRFGQSGLNFYMREYGDYYYTISGFGNPWVPNGNNESAGYFIKYLRDNNYTVLAMPDAAFCQLDLPNATAVINELIVRYLFFGISEYRAFNYGNTTFHVWVL